MIIVLHGALGSHHQFQPLLEALGHQGTFIELPGHGGTPDIDQSWSINTFSDCLEKMFDAEGYSGTKIFGYSMGGYIAMNLARRRPDLVRHIVTLGTKLAWSPAMAAKEALRLDPQIIEQKVPAFADDLRQRHGEEHWKTVLAKTAELMLDLGDHPLLTPENIGEIQATIRFGIGDRDELVTLDETVNFYKAASNAELSVLPGTRHPIETVKSRLIQDLIRPLVR